MLVQHIKIADFDGPDRRFEIARISLTHVGPDRLEYVVIRADGSKANGYVGGTAT